MLLCPIHKFEQLYFKAIYNALEIIVGEIYRNVFNISRDEKHLFLGNFVGARCLPHIGAEPPKHRQLITTFRSPSRAPMS